MWEYKKVRWGPFSWKKKVPKPTVQGSLADDRAAQMALDPDADVIARDHASIQAFSPDDASI